MALLYATVIVLTLLWSNSPKRYASKVHLKRHCASFTKRFVQCPNWYVFAHFRSCGWRSWRFAWIVGSYARNKTLHGTKRCVLNDEFDYNDACFEFSSIISVSIPSAWILFMPVLLLLVINSTPRVLNDVFICSSSISFIFESSGSRLKECWIVTSAVRLVHIWVHLRPWPLHSIVHIERLESWIVFYNPKKNLCLSNIAPDMSDRWLVYCRVARIHSIRFCTVSWLSRGMP
jgi:hypothetical protein